MNHTPEPWHVRTIDGSLGCIDSVDDNSVANTQQIIGDSKTHDTRLANARRIVACVNACAGIPTEQLERVKDDVTPIFELLLQTTLQRDELLAALKVIVDLDDGDKPDLWHFESEFEAARAAIAKVEGSHD